MTLYELVLRQKITGESDSQLIGEWFVSNNMALEGIDIVSKIAKKKINDDEYKYGWLASDLSIYCATPSLIKIFGVEDGCYLDGIIRRFIICDRLGEKFEEKYPQDIKWLKEKNPNQKFAIYLLAQIC